MSLVIATERMMSIRAVREGMAITIVGAAGKGKSWQPCLQVFVGWSPAREEHCSGVRFLWE